MSTLSIRTFDVDVVQFADYVAFEGKRLFIKEKIAYNTERFAEVKIQLVPAWDCHLPNNTIMDILPIATKALGTLGSGITHRLGKVNVVLTGCIQKGEQFHEFGSSEGFLDEQLMFDRPGTPRSDAFLIVLDFIVQEGNQLTRELCAEIYATADVYMQEIRQVLKEKEAKEASRVQRFVDRPYRGQKKVVYVKQVAGQGAMYDTLVYPNEPCGFQGGEKIIDLGNMPMFLSPNEMRDGALRALE